MEEFAKEIAREIVADPQNAEVLGELAKAIAEQQATTPAPAPTTSSYGAEDWRSVPPIYWTPHDGKSVEAMAVLQGTGESRLVTAGRARTIR
jgi:hypothetical protein